MIFRKPDIRYTDMCIWIDKVVYTDQCDDTLLFEYLYHLVNMLARQGGYFRSARHYDEFAMNGATRVFLRLKNHKQFELDENGEPKLTRIKSVLNYIKSILYPMKVVYEQQTYAQVGAKPTSQEEENYYSSTVDFSTTLSQGVDTLSLVDFNVYLHDLPKTCWAFLNKIPKKQNSDEWTNIYFSCLLTFLNSVTLNNKNKQRIQDMAAVLHQKPKLLNRLYREERKDCVILYHLPPEMRDYIYVLYNRIRHLIARDLSNTMHTYIPSAMGAKNLILSSLLQDGMDGPEDDQE